MTTITLRDIKSRIERDDLAAVQAFYNELRSDEDAAAEIDWTTLFKDCYLHACLKKKPRITAWFEEVFKDFDPIAKIALRQIFAYGRYLSST